MICFFFFNLELICLITVIHISISALVVPWRFIHSNSGFEDSFIQTLHISIFWGLETHLGEWISPLPPTSLPLRSFYLSGGDRQTESSLCRRLNNNLGQRGRVMYTPGGEDGDAGSESDVHPWRRRKWEVFPRSCSLNLGLKWEGASSLWGAGLSSGELQRRGTGMEGQHEQRTECPRASSYEGIQGVRQSDVNFRKTRWISGISGITRLHGGHMEDGPTIQQGLWLPTHIWIWKSRWGRVQSQQRGAPHGSRGGGNIRCT